MKELNERAIEDKFVAAYNSRHGTNFAYKGRPTEAPDLTYVDGAAELNVEVGTAYYDDHADAKLQWEAARGSPNAPRLWSGINFDNRMVENINVVICRKCQGTDYGPQCVLLVHVRPKLTTIADMRKLLRDIKLPSRIPFDGIYVSGDFPDGSDSPDDEVLRGIEAFMAMDAAGTLDAVVTVEQRDGHYTIVDGNKRAVAFYESRKASGSDATALPIYLLRLRRLE